MIRSRLAAVLLPAVVTAAGCAGERPNSERIAALEAVILRLDPGR